MIAQHNDTVYNPDQLTNNRGITPSNCHSSHGISGYLEGTQYDVTKGVYICPCGREYFGSGIKQPEWIPSVHSYSTSPEIGL